jgi:predicted transcriptional regulator
LKEWTLTTQKVLEAISTEESQELFNLIAEDKNSYDVVESGIMTRKQYYLRLGKLVKLDLIKRVGKRYALTTFGYIIYETQLTLVMVITSYNAIDSANMIPTSEGFEVVNQIIL